MSRTHGDTWSTPCSSISISAPVAEARPRGLIDTSALIGLESVDSDHLPREMAISAITLAELAAGPHATNDAAERAGVRIGSSGRNRSSNRSRSGKKARGRRAVDLLIAATALAEGLPLYTRNVGDFAGIVGMVDLVPVPLRTP